MFIGMFFMTEIKVFLENPIALEHENLKKKIMS